MKLAEFSDAVFKELREELEIYQELGTLPVRKVTGSIHAIQGAVDKLKKYFFEHGPNSTDEEIMFFKKSKPAFNGEHYYAMEIFSIENNRPVNDRGQLKAFYETELRYIHRFLEQNKFLYAYYQFELTELDHALFVRRAKPVDIPVPDIIGADPAFTTCCDMLWGKFIAFERLKKWLTDEIDSLQIKPEPLFVPEQSLQTGGNLKWTGESINLVELAYGIWLTGQLNHGQVSISEIIENFERVFHVKIGKPHRRWQGIANRKRLTPTKFINELKDALIKRLDEEMSK